MQDKHPDILVRLQQLNAELAQEHALLARFARPIEDQIQQATVDLREKHAREMGICEGRIAEMGRLINGLGRQLQERDQVIALLEGAIRGAPHAEGCPMRSASEETAMKIACTCWKNIQG